MVRSCGLLLPFVFLAGLQTNCVQAATLLTSDLIITGGSLPGGGGGGGGFSDTGSGRVGGYAQPLGSASSAGVVRETRPAPSRASVSEDSGGTTTRTRAPQSRPRAKRRAATEDEAPTPRKPRFRSGTAPTDESGPRSRDVEPKKPGVIDDEPSTSHEVPPAPDESVEGGGTQVLATTARSPWSAELGLAWYSDYQSFRGVNILDSVSSESGTGGVVTSSLKVGYARPNDAFTFGFNYWQGLDRITPKGAETDVPPNSQRRDKDRFSLPARDRYAEYNFNLGYSRNFFDGALVGSVGYNHFHFSDGNFYKSTARGKFSRPIEYANEFTLGAAYTLIPYIQPSINWSHDFDGFKGDYVELRIDGAYDLYSQGDFGVRLRPYAAVSYDFKYNGTDNGWNAVEIGVNVPVQLNSFLTLTFTGNYVQPLEETQGEPRASDGFWGGVRLSAAWGGPAEKAELASYGKDSKLVVAEPEDHPWEVAVGAGWRQANYDFSQDPAKPFSTAGLFTQRTRTGSLNFATPGTLTRYDNGLIDARTPAINPNLAAGNPPGSTPGTAAFQINNASQVFDQPGVNGQVRFNTNDYVYSTKGKGSDGQSNDQDSYVSPYLTMSREIARKGNWSVRGGLLYAFSQTAGDSGYRLLRLDTTIEQTKRYGFVYSLDQIAQSGSTTLVPNAIINSSIFQRTLNTNLQPFSGSIGNPQPELAVTQQDVARVGTFVRSTLDLTSNDVALPFSLRYDFGNRLRVEFTTAPTFTLASASLDTVTDYRSFNEFRQGDTNVGLRAVSRPAFQFPNFNGGGGGGGVNPAPVVAGTPVVSVQSQTATATGGGKSSVPRSPGFPGKLIGRDRVEESVQKALFGVSGGASVILDLNEERTFFAELWGRYNWVQSFGLDNGSTQSNVDLSSFQGGFGLGYRF